MNTTADTILLAPVKVGDTLAHQERNVYCGQDWHDIDGHNKGRNSRCKVVGMTKHYVDVKYVHGTVQRVRKSDGKSYNESSYRVAPLSHATS